MTRVIRRIEKIVPQEYWSGGKEKIIQNNPTEQVPKTRKTKQEQRKNPRTLPEDGKLLRGSLRRTQKSIVPIKRTPTIKNNS